MLANNLCQDSSNSQSHSQQDCSTLPGVAGSSWKGDTIQLTPCDTPLKYLERLHISVHSLRCLLEGLMLHPLTCAGFLSVALGALFMSGSGLFISLFRQRIGPLFVDDLGVSREVARVAPICAAYQVFDGIAGTSSGVLRCGIPLTLHSHKILCGLASGQFPGWTCTFGSVSVSRQPSANITHGPQMPHVVNLFCTLPWHFAEHIACVHSYAEKLCYHKQMPCCFMCNNISCTHPAEYLLRLYFAH